MGLEEPGRVGRDGPRRHERHPRQARRVDHLLQRHLLHQVVAEAGAERLGDIGEHPLLERGSAQIRLQDRNAQPDLRARHRELDHSRGLALADPAARYRHRVEPVPARRELQVGAQDPVGLVEGRDRRLRAAAPRHAAENGYLEAGLHVARRAQAPVEAVAQEGERHTDREGHRAHRPRRSRSRTSRNPRRTRRTRRAPPSGVRASRGARRRALPPQRGRPYRSRNRACS